ncbi:P-loop NTPase family protein [Lactiplantibacillus plantarum]|uniref:hypothetical protein n=1 Tax=Lactiplantibacillus plantarum TaxID=1590 RepID=UPI000976F6C1|nr:hypothetical protein [Lactiplantibacillus plantarum]
MGTSTLSRFQRGALAQLVNEGNKSYQVMAAGPVPPNPAELIGSKRMAEVMEWARDHFDLVLVDATPVLAVADAQVALKYSDGIVIVVKMGKP